MCASTVDQGYDLSGVHRQCTESFTGGLFSQFRLLIPSIDKEGAVSTLMFLEADMPQNQPGQQALDQTGSRMLPEYEALRALISSATPPSEWTGSKSINWPTRF